MLSLNPYIAGNPVGGTPNFIGRADILREVLRVMRHPHQNLIVLYGQRRIGKTSVLQQLAASLPTEGHYYPIYFDLQDKASWPLSRVLTDLARAISYELAQQGPPELRATGPLLSDEEPVRAFQETWLPAILQRLPEGHSIVLLFDEFDVLADPKGGQAGADLFPYLRGLLATDPARLQFAFVIGRKVEDLESIALSLFKGAPALRVSLFNKADTFELTRLSERNDTLQWSDDALEKVWDLTHGHPFLTQQLCSRTWENLYDSDPTTRPTVLPEDVEHVIPETLEASRNTLEWLWDGLPPAERVVISALAGAGNRAITQPQLEQLLRESGVRVVIRELQNAPQLLQDWDLIEPAEGGYRFRVELFRLWILEHKPLTRVQEELDRIEPLAENLYQAAYGFFRSNQLEDAMPLLRQAIGLNPNHARSRQLLAEIFLLRGEVDQAVQILQLLYDTQPAVARPRLVQALILKAEDEPDEDKRLAIYQQILIIDPAHPTTLQRVADIQRAARQRELDQRQAELQKAEKEKRYRDALDLARKLAEKYPDARDWQPDLDRLERKTKLADDYQRALGALNSGNKDAALRGLADVIVLEPDYEEATRYLHLAKTGHDPALMLNQLAGEQKAHNKVKSRLEEETQARTDAENQRNELQIRLDSERQHIEATRRTSRRMTYWSIGSTLLAVAFFIAWLLSSVINSTDLSVTQTALAESYTEVSQMETDTAEERATSVVLPTDTPTLTPTDAELSSPTPDMNGTTPGASPNPTSTPTQEPTAIPTPNPYAGLLAGIPDARMRLGRGQLFDTSLSPDGNILVVVSSIGIYVYDGATFADLWSESTTSPIHAIAVSSTGLLVTGMTDGSVVQRDAQSGQNPITLLSLNSSVSRLAFSPDGSWLAIGLDDGMIILWDVKGQSVISTLDGHVHGITALAFSQDGKALVSGAYDNSIIMWDLNDPQAPQRDPPYATNATVWSLAWSAENLLAWGEEDGTVEYWNVSTNEIITLPKQPEAIKSVLWTLDGQLVTGSVYGDLLFWDLSTQDVTTLEPARILSVNTPNLLRLQWGPDGSLLATTEGGAQRLNVEADQVTQTLVGFTSPINSLAFSPDGSQIVSGSDDGVIRLWDTTTGGLLNTFAGHRDVVTSVAFSPDGVTLASGSGDGTIRFWDINAGAIPTETITYTVPIWSVVFSPADDKRLAFSAEDGSVKIWDREANKTLTSFLGHQSPVYSLAFSSDGSYLASGSEGGTVILWDTVNSAILKVFDVALGGHTGSVYSVAFSANLLGSGSEDEKMIIWQAPSGELYGNISSAAINAIAFSPERGLLAGGSPDTTVYVWLVSNLPADPVELLGHTAEVNSVAFSPVSADVLATGSNDGTIILWDTSAVFP